MHRSSTRSDAELEIWGASGRARCSRRCSSAMSLSRSPRSRSIHGRADAAAQFPRQADHRRRHRRIGKEHAAQLAMRYLQAQGLQAVLHRMEQRGPGQGGDEKGQEEDVADADDVFAAARDGFRASAGAQHPPAAEGRDDRAGGSICVHGVRARCRARVRSRRGCGRSTSSPRGRIGRFISTCRSTSASRASLSGRAKIKDYEAGMDLKLAPDRVESFKIFQGRILDEYATHRRRIRPDRDRRHAEHRRAAADRAADDRRDAGRLSTAQPSTPKHAEREYAE